MQLIHAQQLLTQRNVAVHLVHIGVHGLYEIRVYLLRHLRRVQRGGKRRGIFPRLREEAELLELPVQRRGDGVPVFAEAAVIRPERVFAQDPVRAFKQRHEGLVRQRVLRPGGVLHCGEAQIRVSEHAAHVVRRLRHFARRGQQRLLRGGKRVRGHAADAVYAAAVHAKLRCGGEKLRHLLLRDGNDLRRCEGRRAGRRDVYADGLAAHVQIDGVARVLVALAACIAQQHPKAHVGLVLQPEELQQRLRALAQPPGVCRYPLRQRFQRLILCVPRRVVRVHVRKVPCVFLGYLFPLRYRVDCHMALLMNHFALLYHSRVLSAITAAYINVSHK